MNKILKNTLNTDDIKQYKYTKRIKYGWFTKSC